VVPDVRLEIVEDFALALGEWHGLAWLRLPNGRRMDIPETLPKRKAHPASRRWTGTMCFGPLGIVGPEGLSLLYVCIPKEPAVGQYPSP
jgi:hypothetical protein